MLNPPSNDETVSGHDPPADAPSVWKQVFATPFTPSWSLGLLMFLCLFLPSYRGCNNEVIYLYDVVGRTEPKLGDIYMVFLIIWPFLFGLLVTLGTLWLVTGRDLRRARVLWWCSAVLVLVNLLLLVAGLVDAWLQEESVNLPKDFWDAWWLLVPSVVLPAVALITVIRCRTWYSAAIWLQLAVAAVAAVSVSILTPGLLLAKELLIGGLLAVAASALIALATLIQLLDGQRVLLRRRGESPLQLSLRAMLLLMLLGGLSCAWIGGALVIEVEEPAAAAEEAEQEGGS